MKLTELQDLLKENSKPCEECGRTAVKYRLWRYKLTTKQRSLAKEAGYTALRGAKTCVACDRRRTRRAAALPTIPVPEPYYDDAGNFYPACGNDPEMWFPGQAMSSNVYAQTQAAKAACATCPIREQCLELAMEAEGGSHTFYRHGIFGGLTPKERFSLARKEGREGHARLYRTLYCKNGHDRRHYWNEREGCCEACVAVASGAVVRTNAERSVIASSKEILAGLY